MIKIFVHKIDVRTLTNYALSKSSLNEVEILGLLLKIKKVVEYPKRLRFVNEGWIKQAEWLYLILMFTLSFLDYFLLLSNREARLQMQAVKISKPLQNKKCLSSGYKSNYRTF